MGSGVFKSAPGFGHPCTKPSEILRNGNIYMVCEEDEDLTEAMN